jgi:hypothetical protein
LKCILEHRVFYLEHRVLYLEHRVFYLEHRVFYLDDTIPWTAKNKSTSNKVRLGKFILTSVVGTNSDPSDEIIYGLSFIFPFALPRLPQVPLVARPVK